MNSFNSYRDSIVIKDSVKSKHVTVGEHSYYAGYYHGKAFDDCIMYLDELDDVHPADQMDGLIIGKFCSIATGAQFMLGGTQGHNYNWISNYPLDFLDDDYDNYQTIPPKAHQLKGDTVIGNDVWIGADALIMPGIRIGNGAVVGARAVVTKNIGSYEIWAGNPARLIKKRFSDDEIAMLLELKWWNWNLDKIKQHLDIIRSNDVRSLFEQITK